MTENAQLEQALIDLTVENALTKAGASAKLLAPHVRSALVVHDGRVIVKDSHLSVDEYVATLRNDADLGRAFTQEQREQGGTGSARDTMSTSEKVEYIRKHGADAFNKLPPSSTAAQQDQTNRTPTREHMTPSEKVAYIRKYGAAAYFALPW